MINQCIVKVRALVCVQEQARGENLKGIDTPLSSFHSFLEDLHQLSCQVYLHELPMEIQVECLFSLNIYLSL